VKVIRGRGRRLLVTACQSFKAVIVWTWRPRNQCSSQTHHSISSQGVQE
jgi:hypothetical protein